MEKKLFLFVFLIFLLFPSILSECNSSQVDINNASKEKLEDINEVGSSTAKEIIESRPFNSLDDLIDVKYIGEITLKQIKNQSVCVETSEKSEDSEEENSSDNSENENIDYDFDNINSTKNNDKSYQEDTENKNPEIIKLSPPSKPKQDKDKNSSDPKVIKKANSFNFQKNKSKYASYGLGIVTILVIGLMLIKYRKNRYKNEFRE